MDITPDTLGLLGSYLFTVLVIFSLYKVMTWGAVSKAKEEEFMKAASVDVLEENGRPLTIIREVKNETNGPK